LRERGPRFSLAAMRQLIAVFFYLLAGFLLLCVGMVAFLPAPDASWGGVMAVMSVMALGPLLIAAWVSPGARVREVGMVLLVAGVLIALGAVMVAAVFLSPGFRDLLPPDAAKDLSGFPTPVVGIVLCAAMIGGGLWMVIKGPSRTPLA
jgi:hypothetical protein